MAIKCFKKGRNYKAYVNSKYICCVRECGDGEVAINTIDRGTIYTEQSIESIVRWWRKEEQEIDVKEPKFDRLANINNRSRC